MKTIQTVEFGTFKLDLDEVVTDGILDVRPEIQKLFEFSFRDHQLIVRPLGFIGLIPLNSLIAVDVQPRIEADVSRILELSGVAPTMLHEVVRGYSQNGQLLPNLLELYARSLELAIQQIIARGFIKKYVSVEECTSAPSGRILCDQTIRSLRARGISHDVIARRFERSIDVDINRILLFSVLALEKRLQHDEVLDQSQRIDIAQILNRCVLRLGRITLDRRPDGINIRSFDIPHSLPRSRAYYSNAVALARSIIEGTGVALDIAQGPLEMQSMVLRMSQAFEAYVRALLVRGLWAIGGEVEVLDGTKIEPEGGGLKSIFEDGAARSATPDIVVRNSRRPNSYSLIADAKYKPIRSGLDREDLNQIIVYGLAYNCSTVLIIHPKHVDGDPGLHQIGVIRNIAVYTYALDISRDRIATQEIEFVAAVSHLIHS